MKPAEGGGPSGRHTPLNSYAIPSRLREDSRMTTTTNGSMAGMAGPIIPTYFQRSSWMANRSMSVNETSEFRYTTPRVLGRSGYARWLGVNAWQAETEAGACMVEPGYFLFSLLCPHVAAFLQRRRLLLADIRNYRCCGGIWCPGHCHGMEGVEGSWICLCLEIACCLPVSVHTNRYILQQHYHLKPTPCDDCAYACGGVLGGLGADWQTWAPLCTLACAVPCLLSQQQHEMDVRGYPKNLLAGLR